ncbi:MAG: GNAT family N-acetyltransferase [Flavobacterium sp. MedPE-SWcel]|uniref:GNAT family N-acetyltransferase n=1 Tax=uncultured Flavobacterium sp. TaxID=165435 RepID=UPI000910488E|nr:GNAT family N-acetyltransferase [uncultured Flavobacterium sp.]OIQ21005.1 MAG: GNAT family N-acetyltransferase [Flavobacterium sp. MedPE-SWcel]
MITLQGDSVYLRALEPDDLEFIYQIENDEKMWEVSNTITPYSRFLIRQYLDNAHQDIFEAKQLRLVICKNNTFKAVGLIDIFDFDPLNQRAGVGIVIKETAERSIGIGTEALGLLIDYAFKTLQLHQLYANINPTNVSSVALFTNFDFTCIGVKKDWNKRENQFFDEAIYQLINKL